MAFDHGLAERIRDLLGDRRVSFREIRMFGGLAFMVRGHMTVGVMKDGLLVRIEPGSQPEVLKEPQVRTMEFTGRPMKGIVLVSVEGTDREEDLERWIDHALAFTGSLPAKEASPAPLRRKR
jgi:TfoX/Sxy family transcriptional regulator of competence genes